MPFFGGNVTSQSGKDHNSNCTPQGALCTSESLTDRRKLQFPFAGMIVSRKKKGFQPLEKLKGRAARNRDFLRLNLEALVTVAG